jgi:hypothetical protein
MLANYPQSNTFTAPGLSLTGNCGYEIQNDRIIIDISEIANQRDSENISGTLSIELWALKAPYTGADFNGFAVAGTSIGELFGQHYLANCRYDLDFQEPPTGTWYLTLMLREWTGMGYESRDYINFSLPYIVSNKPAISRTEADNVINVSFTGNKNNSATAATKAGKATQKKPETEAAISLNSASLQDIVSVKGISQKLAENLDAARPFESLDEVLKVKGMGPKLWQKIRDFISL